MLNHKKNIALLVSLLLLCFACIYLFHFSYWVFIFPFLIFQSIEIIGASMLSANFHFTSLCDKKTDKKVVAITFDDGPHGEETEKVLAVLKEENVLCTFFCIGNKIEQDISLTKRIHEAGHIIGNHSYLHGNLFDLQSTKKLTEELEKTNELIQQSIGKKPLLFRPPYGVATPALGRAIKNNNMVSVGWNIRSFDTSIKTPERILERVIPQIKPGSIILLHDRLVDCDKAVQLLIGYLKKNNYTITNLDKLLNISAYA